MQCEKLIKMLTSYDKRRQEIRFYAKYYLTSLLNRAWIIVLCYSLLTLDV